MRQIPMLTTVAQNQTTWELEFSDPHVVWFAPPLSTSEFREAFFTVLLASTNISAIGIVRYHCGGSMELNARILLLAYMVYL